MVNSVTSANGSTPLTNDELVDAIMNAQMREDSLQENQAGGPTLPSGQYDPSQASWLDPNEILGSEANDPAAQAQLKQVIHTLSTHNQLGLVFSTPIPTDTFPPIATSSSSTSPIASTGSTYSGAPGQSNTGAPGQSSFDVKSWGDPHITETIGGTSQTQNDMNSESDLVDLNGAIGGGYQVSTRTTAPNANGVTYNKSAAVTLGAYTMRARRNESGQDAYTVSAYGLRERLQKGQTLNLGNGSVSLSQNGVLSVNASTGSNSVQTLITDNGNGFDVDTSGQSNYLGGYGADQFTNVFNSTRTLET